jgi:glycerol-3-phosphate acyltransferase PlsX
VSPTTTIRIAVDAMGGDKGPIEVAHGVYEAARASSKAHFFLVGDPTVLEPELARMEPRLANLELVPATQVIEMEDAPATALKRKPDASLVVAARLVKEKRADAIVTIANTGAAMAVSLLSWGRIKGVDRPAIAVPLPSLKGPVVLLDAGATVDCDANNLFEFAIMGSVYAEQVLGIKNPRVGLVSNGEEEVKGNALVKRTHTLFQQALTGDSPFRFMGNVEGRDIFRGDVDVAVCDGFVGNVILKTAEGVAEMIQGMMKQELTSKTWTKVLAAPLAPSLRGLGKRLHYSAFGGAPMLGVNGICIIGHGRSDRLAVSNACRAAERAAQHALVETLRQRICDPPPPPPAA